MIKNSIQLKNAEKRLIEIQKEMYNNSLKYSGLELDLYNSGLAVEEEELLDQIIEYKKLVSLPFSDAIDLLFKKPVLIDNIGDLLAKLRIAAKLSQKDMAKRLGWEQSNLSRFESENYNSQTINKIVEYASSLGIWLHVRPSLTEELNILEKKILETRKPYIPVAPDIATTSTEYVLDSTGDSTYTQKSVIASSDVLEVSSI